MTHSATTRTDMAWNKSGSLGFSISQRHLCASLAARSPLVKETAGGLRTAFERHGEFAGHILARKVVRPAAGGPGGHGGQDNRDMEFVHLASRSGRPHSPGPARSGMPAPSLMRYTDAPGRTELTSSAAEKSGFPRASGSPPSLEAAANPTRMDAAVPQAAPVQQAQQVQMVHVMHRSIHGESSLSGPEASRGGPEDSVSLPGSPRSAFIAPDEILTGNDRSGKQKHEPATAETLLPTVLSPVRPESTGIPAVLARAPLMPATAESGNAALQGSSGSTSCLASSETPAPTSSVRRRLHPDIGSGSRAPLAPSYGSRGISTISPVSGMVARQAGDMANSNRLAGIHIGRHTQPEAVTPQRFLSHQGKPLVQTARTRAEARTDADATIAGPQPERNVRVTRPGTQPGSAHEGHAPDTACSPVLARQPIPDAFMPDETRKIHNGEGNAGSIAPRAVVSRGTNAPGNQAVPGHADSISDLIVLPHVFPASPFTLVQRQAEPQHFPRDGFMGTHHAGWLPLLSRADALAIGSTRLEARSGIARSRILERPADPTAKNQGNRHGGSTHLRFLLRYAVPDTILRAVDRVGEVSGTAPAMAAGGGKERSFLRRVPALASHALSPSGIGGIGGMGGVGADAYPGQPSSPARSRLLSGGISGGESILAGFMHPSGERSSTIGELPASDATLRRATIVSPVSGSGSTAVPVHPPAAGAGESWPAATPSSHGYQEVMLRKPDSAPAGSPALSLVSRTFAMQADSWKRGRDSMEVGFEEGKPASPSHAARARADTVERPLVLAHRVSQMRQVQRMEAAMEGGEVAWGRIMRVADDANGGSAHSFPLARQETPEDRYGVVPAPSPGLGRVHGAPGSEVAAAESSAGRPDADEMAEQTWRLISERLVIEQERRGLASWHR